MFGDRTRFAYWPDGSFYVDRWPGVDEEEALRNFTADSQPRQENDGRVGT
jgi:hypothetical protein